MTRLTHAAAALALAGSALFAASAQAEDHTVAIKGSAFQPPALQVSLGDTVTFVNMDRAPHTATSQVFDTEIIYPGESAVVVAEIPGTHDYMCAFHPGMRGVIDVR